MDLEEVAQQKYPHKFGKTTSFQSNLFTMKKPTIRSDTDERVSRYSEFSSNLVIEISLI